MHGFHRYSALTAFGLVIATFITGCGESKVTQCNKLADIINKGEPTLNKVANEMGNLGKGKQPSNLKEVKEQALKGVALFNKAASEMDGLTQQIKAVKLEDEKLLGFQKRYTQSLGEASQSIRDMGQQMNQLSKIDQTPASLQKIAKIQSNIESLAKKGDKASNAADKVVGELNSYCNAK
jgi:hypothetical protein